MRRYTRAVIFKRVGDGRPYPDHGLTSRGWAEVPPRQVRLDELVTTKDTLQLATLLDEDSTFYGDLFAHVVEWRGSSTSRTACTGRCAPPCSSATCCTPACTWWRADAAGGLKSAVTLVVLTVLLVLVGLWGWNAATEPFPGKLRPRRCARDVRSHAGEQVFPQQVTVSVYNASDRNGLAGRTMDAASWTRASTRATPATRRGTPRSTRRRSGPTTPDNPDVQLVATPARGGRPRWSAETGWGAGVTVVVGDEFEELARARRSVIADDDADICSPPVS